MCMAIPFKVVSVEGFEALCERGGVTRRIDASLVGGLTPGETVLVFNNQAVRRVDEDEAALIDSALGALSAVLEGRATEEDIASALPDKTDGEPVLPEHLRVLVGKKVVD